MSYVAMEQHMCKVCGKIHEHNTGILINKILRDIPDNKRITGYGLCKECDDLSEEYLAIIEIALSKSRIGTSKELVKPKDAYRTGTYAHIKRSAVPNVFDIDSIEIDTSLPFIYVEEGVIDKLHGSTE